MILLRSIPYLLRRIPKYQKTPSDRYLPYTCRAMIEILGFLIWYGGATAADRERKDAARF